MKFDKRKVSAVVKMRDDKLEFHAALASGLETQAGPFLVRSHLVRRPPCQSLMRPVRVVPREVETEFMPHVGQPQGHEDGACAFGLHGADEPFEDGDAAVLADRAEAQVDLPAPCPAFEGRAIELAAPVADEVPGLGLVPADGAIRDVSSQFTVFDPVRVTPGN